VFVQELFKEYRFDKRRTPWRQTPPGGGVLWISSDEEVLGLEANSQKSSGQNDDCTGERVSAGTVHGGKK